MKVIKISDRSWLLQYLIGILAFIACMTPRFIPTFKIHIGMNISFFTILAIMIWGCFSRRLVIYKSLESYIFLIWLLLVVASLAYSKSIGDWLYYFVWIITTFFFLQILYTSGSKTNYDCVIYAIVFALLIHLVIGLYEIVFRVHLFHTGNYGVRFYGTTPISIFHNPNDYATFVATTMPFVLYLFGKTRVKAFRIIYAVVGVFSIYMLLSTKSRAAFYALVIAAFVMILLRYKRSGRFKILFIIAGSLLIAGILVSSRIQNLLLDQIAGNSINMNVTGDINRINLINNGIEFLKQTHGLGIGAGNMKYWLEHRLVYYVGGILYFHNWYLELLVTFGVGFFILYVCFHCKILYKLFKHSIVNKRIRGLSSAMLMSFTIFSVVCISSSSNAYSEWVWMYYAVISTYCLYLKDSKVLIKNYS